MQARKADPAAHAPARLGTINHPRAQLDHRFADFFNTIVP